MLKNDYLVAKMGVDPAENELFQVVGKIDFQVVHLVRRGEHLAVQRMNDEQRAPFLACFSGDPKDFALAQ